MKSEKSNHIDMNKRDLKKLSKSELITLLLKQQKKPKIIVVDDTKPVPTLRAYKPVPARRRPVPTPRKSVKDMVQQYEENIIPPPPEFRDKPIQNHYKLLFQYQRLKNKHQKNQFLKKELLFHKLKKH